LEVIAVLYYKNHDGAIRACDLYYNHIYIYMFIKVIVLAPLSVWFSTTTYLSSCSFLYLCVPCYCCACRSLLHCVWECRRYKIQYH